MAGYGRLYIVAWRLAVLPLLLLIFLFSLPLVSAAEIRTESAQIDFSTVQVYPEPVEPGEDVVVKINVKNMGAVDAKDVKVNPRIVYPFQLKSQEDNWFLRFNLCAQCTRENTYYLLIDPQAGTGEYPLIFDIAKGPTKQTETVNIKVEGVPDVILLTGSNDPILVEPKQQFKVNLVLKNIGTGIAKNLKVISRSDDFVTSGSNTQFIEELGVSHSANVTAYFTGNEELEPNVYNFPVAVEYKDAVGGSHSYEGSIGVTLRNKAELSIKNVKTRPDYIESGDQYEISLRVENTGSGNAKGTLVTIKTGASEITQYIGQLKKDEDSNVVSSFSARNGKLLESGIQLLDIEVSYDDDLGRHKLVEQIAVEIHPNSGYLFYLLYVLIGICAILVFVLYMMRAKRLERKENMFEEVVEYGLADEFVSRHKGKWSDADFNGLVKELRSKRFHIDPDRLRRYLEKVRVEQKHKKRG
jgi:hypothetical protein